MLRRTIFLSQYERADSLIRSRMWGTIRQPLCCVPTAAHYQCQLKVNNFINKIGNSIKSCRKTYLCYKHLLDRSGAKPHVDTFWKSFVMMHRNTVEHNVE